MLPGPQICTSDLLLVERLSALRSTVQRAAASSGRSADSVTLVAVSKGQSVEAIRAAAAHGQRHFGENYLQEAIPKIEALKALALSWHYIGRLQANKTRPTATLFDWVHTVDRATIAERLSAQRPHHAPPLNICLQVNIKNDPAKAGVSVDEVAALAAATAALPQLRLRGLMCMLPEELSALEQRHAFGEMLVLAATLRQRHSSIDTLSMGMSGDYPEAIAAGATMIRIGTAIFGARV